MKKFFFLLVLIFLSCQSTQKLHTEKYKGKDILVGKAQRTDLEKEPYRQWFADNYAAYQPDQRIIQQLKPIINDYKFTVLLGTWCGDSQEQVPVLFKVLDQVGYHKQPELYCVPRKYKYYQPAKDYKIIRVPTIIVYYKGKEKARIIEYPMQSMEADLLKIMTGNTYLHELNTY